jgi:hypothetical protein
MSNFYEILNSDSLDGISSVFDDFQEVLEDYSENLIAWNDSEDVAASKKSDGSYNDFVDSRTANADGSVKPFFPKLEANSILVNSLLIGFSIFLTIVLSASGININININVNSNNVTNVTNESDIENNDEFQERLEAEFQKIAEELKQCSQKMNKN